MPPVLDLITQAAIKIGPIDIFYRAPSVCFSPGAGPQPIHRGIKGPAARTGRYGQGTGEANENLQCRQGTFVVVQNPWRSMRRIFSLVLMLLLVLRGLMGAAMAAGMLPALPADGPTQPAHTAHQLHEAHTSDNTPVAGSGSGVVLTADDSMGPQDQGLHPVCSDPASGRCDGSAHTHSPLCSACEICHSAVLSPPGPNTPPHLSAVEVHSGTSARFASATAALAIKPPIA